MYYLEKSKFIVCDGHGRLGIVVESKNSVNSIEWDFRFSFDRFGNVICFVEDKTNDQLKILVAKIEDLSPQTPYEERILKGIHNALCERLNWKPVVLTHQE